MSRLEKGLLKTAVILAIAVAIALPIRYRTQFLDLAAQTPVVGPYLLQRFADAPVEDDNIAYWTCSMHPHVHEAGSGVCPICGMDLVPVYKPGTGPEGAQDVSAKLMDPGMQMDPGGPEIGPEQLATFVIDPTWQQALAVTTAPVRRRALEAQTRTVGRVTYDENRLVDVYLKLSGWIQRLHVAETGQLVVAGQPLFDLYSPELVSTQQEYLLALDGVERLRKAPVREIPRMARSLLEASRQRLLRWDLTPAQIERLTAERQVVDALPIMAPAGGYVVEKMATEGMRVDPGMRLYRLADLSTVWVVADVYESELGRVRVGQTVSIRLAYAPERQWHGRVDLIYPTIDVATRTAQVRIVVPNDDLALLPDMYADVLLQHGARTVLAIPREAVIDLGTRKVVFVDLGGGRLQAREVSLTREVGQFAQVGAGLVAGDRVVTSGNFLVDAESKIRGVVPLPLGSDRVADALAGGSQR